MGVAICSISTEQEFLRGLFAHEKNVDTETGNFTDAGLANLGSLAASHYVTEYDIGRYRDEIKELQRMADSGELVSEKLGLKFNSKEDLLKYLDETYTKEQDRIKELYSLETEIYNLEKERYQAELDYLKDLIDAKKESLQASKDLHDYNKTINEKTNDITTLRKQIAAYSGDTSQEGMAKLQKLQKELADKEEDLAETEYERLISDQQDMLDKLYEEYEDLLSKKMDDFMTLVKEGFDTANGSMAIIASYIKQVAEDNGYDLQTDGLFDGSSKKDIKDNSGKAAKDVEKDKKNQSGTKENKRLENNINLSNAKDYIKENAKKADKKRNEYSAVNKAIYDMTGGKVLTDKQLERLAKIVGVDYNGSSKKSNLYKGLVDSGYIKPDDKKKDDGKKDDNKKLRSKAKSYIKKHASKAKKKKTEYSDVNQKIFEDKADAYKGTGKILSTKELKGLSKELGVEYDNGSKKGNLYKKLKSIKFPGFKKGGIAKLIKDKGEDGITFARNGEGFIAPEHVKPIQELVESVPEINKMTETLPSMQREMTPV